MPSQFDCILNEHIKATCSSFMPIYVKLFNTILETGHIPEVWTTGIIRPIYKNKCVNSNHFVKLKYLYK